MYIQPNSQIHILKNVPLDMTYKNSIYFDNATAQYNYFISKSKYNFTQQTYTRANRRTLKINVLADNLYDCNYLMFQNTSYGNRWFYAFIVSVNYINDNVTEVVYDLDVLQTWFFDYTLNQCYIDRQHTASDSRTSNIIPESIGVGELKVNAEHSIYNNTSFDYYVSTTKIADSQGNVYTKVPSRVNGVPIAGGVIHCENFEAYQHTVKWIVDAGYSDAIQGVWVVPDNLPEGEGTDTATTNTHSFNLPTSLDGYTPRNKKLLQYPYCQVEVLSGAGGTMTLAPERFSGAATFKSYTVSLDSGSITIVPTNYNGVSVNNEFLLSSLPFASGSTPTNPYATYLMANNNSIQTQKDNAHRTLMTNQVSTVVNTSAALLGAVGGAVIAGAATGGIGAGAGAALGGSLVGGAASALTGMSKTAVGYRNTLDSINANIEDMKMLPSGSSGTASGTALFMGGLTGFKVRMKTLRAELARSLDEYFDMFGYKINRRQVPNRNVRPHWTFIKTMGCTIIGSIPSDDEEKITSIYDAGITWWRYGDEVGNYTLDNRVQ